MRKKVFSFLVSGVLLTACKSATTEQNIVYEKKNISKEVVREVEVPDRVYFDFDRYDLTGQAKAVLDLQVKWLREEPDAEIVIEGHCDARGSEEYNKALGMRRAEAVKKYLVMKGVAPNRIKVVSYGKNKPAYEGRGEVVWRKNRRAVVVED